MPEGFIGNNRALDTASADTLGYDGAIKPCIMIFRFYPELLPLFWANAARRGDRRIFVAAAPILFTILTRGVDDIG